MNIVFAMIFSIGIKGIAAALEIISQILITNSAGIVEYGVYTFYVSLVEGTYWFLYSGSIKLNTYYLSIPGYSLSSFKSRYFWWFILPSITIFIGCFVAMKNYYGILAGLIILLYYFTFDQSSEFFARRHQLPALLGEYLLGRVTLLIGVMIGILLGFANGITLFSLYGLQFIVVLSWFLFWKRKYHFTGAKQVHVSIHKLIEFQLSDVANSLVSYSPTILQYLMSGAFTAGFTGIITIIGKFINFIAGPTAKVFLPEFSKLYKNLELEELRKTYVMVVRIQMVFIGTIGTVLIVFSQMFLKLFSPELLSLSGIFTVSAICLMFIAGIGPAIGLLQMTGNEHICNRNQWISVFTMVLSWLVLHNDSFFAVWGLCVQCLVQGFLNYYSMCKWFGHNVIPVGDYILLWIPALGLYIFIDYLGLQYSYSAIFLSVLFVFGWNVFFVAKDKMIRSAVLAKFHTK